MIQRIVSGVLHERLGSDAQYGLDAPSGLDAQLDSDLPPKLQVPVHSFAAYQDAELLLQAICFKLVHLFTTYALKIHITN